MVSALLSRPRHRSFFGRPLSFLDGPIHASRLKVRFILVMIQGPSLVVASPGPSVSTRAGRGAIRRTMSQTSRKSREKKSGKWLVRQQPERKEKHRNGQRRANHEQRHELSKLSATHEMQRRRRQTNQTEGETASKTLAFSFARCNQPRSLPAVGPGQGGPEGTRGARGAGGKRRPFSVLTSY